MVNWAQVNNKSLGAIVYRHTLHIRKKSQTELPASCTVFLLSRSTLVRELLGSKFHQWAKGLPHPTRGAQTTSSFASLLTSPNGWSQSIRAVLFGPNCKFGFFIYIKMGQSGMGWGVFSLCKQTSPLSQWSTLAVPMPSQAASQLSCFY